MTQEKQITEHQVFSDDTNRNPLVSSANPLLNTIPQIRHSIVHPDPTHLRQQLINEIRRFEVECQQVKLPYNVIIGARYCLCTALDEAAALTPWGLRSVWSGSGLLVTFHNETWGGEKFFQLLAKLSQNPKDNLFLLELMHFCLLLGFEGRYRVIDNGRTQLETVKQRLFQLISSIRGSYPIELSKKTRAITLPNKPQYISLPVWISIAILSFLVCLLYINLNWKLNDKVNPILAKIYQTNLPNITVSDRRFPRTLNLQNRLQDEIATGSLDVTDLPDRSVITLKGAGLFNTSAIQIKSGYLDVIRRVAEVLNHFNGEILVVGYTDNIPINTRFSRFSSNDALSLARAKSVQKELQRYLNQPERVKAEGKGAQNPLVPNNTASNRAKNRRVEITLFASPVSQTM
ncbi:DotU family type VI secretion system protein [Xenorhabdus griffiniae]|uniref:DotU family type VI secretion system protein n=1 Tax=Xenorhabdus griffiniae TaxID=351672 RepID=A0ABY9XNB4_9GAMM|nr:DotU family type VI secretion system protein [Xenorhabdus griffiniae]MBD1227925.1 DotU family type VI secretion system protein [Xenorhabdus griffiniae]MBE8587001.1 DotU family type VI secretion system protein [Xenorhabdus griffiniae]WMV74464.1 DotU family type VI secretion system protein [Xenorhabdus griffiniae]WNH04142.1 DotU family type VI secretion system protein [Xenorhabdus griffiniae]